MLTVWSLYTKTTKTLCHFGGEGNSGNLMPNGLALAPHKFTKLLKPLFTELRQEGFVSISFLDDYLLLSDSSVAFFAQWGLLSTLKNQCLKHYSKFNTWMSSLTRVTCLSL